MDISKLETQPIHKEKQEEENAMNKEKGANTEDQKTQSIEIQKLETQPRENQTDTYKEQTEEKSGISQRKQKT